MPVNPAVQRDPCRNVHPYNIFQKTFDPDLFCSRIHPLRGAIKKTVFFLSFHESKISLTEKIIFFIFFPKGGWVSPNPKGF